MKWGGVKMDDLSKAVTGNRLRRVIDVWPEVQSILNVSRLDSVCFVERVFNECNLTLYIDCESTGLWFPREPESRERLLSDLGYSDYAHDETRKIGGWDAWRMLPSEYDCIIEYARALSNRDLPPGAVSWTPSNGRPYSTPHLTIMQSAIAEFFEPRHDVDAKKPEVVEWIKGQMTAAGMTDSDNIAQAMFTIIKPSDHDPRKRRG